MKKASTKELKKAAEEAGGRLTTPALPSREKFAKDLERFAPGCGSPTNVAGTNGGKMPCGARLTAFGKTERYFCGACEKAMKSKKAEVPEAVMVPSGLRTRKVWFGLYGGHYDVIVFFVRKPRWVDDDTTRSASHPKGHFDLLANEEAIAGSMWLGEFEAMFPGFDLKPYTTNGRPRDTEVMEVFETRLTAMWSGDKLRGMECHADGW